MLPLDLGNETALSATKRICPQNMAAEPSGVVKGENLSCFKFIRQPIFQEDKLF